MDLKIKDVAELLNVSETTIRRWLAEGKIPAYRLHRQYRFSRIEIENWVMSCKLQSEEGASDFTPFGENQVYPNDPLKNDPHPIAKRGIQHFSLYRAVHKGGIFYVHGKTKENYIRLATQEIANELSLDAEVIAELLLDREKMMPTALNHGIAVPHTRDFLLKGSTDVVSIVFLENPIDWGALDGEKVHTLFFLFACDDKRHLHLLAKLAHLSSNEKALSFLRTHPSKEKILEFIKNWEVSLN